ncbi:reticulocyte binding protein, putative [Plasmodium berghei]|uniref:Reticulocyte binding protein, putative n=2 Tax=Plasmodium berghei TaxID=5821 RepID=A0A509AHF6_PLABA|nr:reticulocyte binding protein, putative [Plasmodium berghei ANKA]SBW38256.1 reticulocyte binding protein, putative [Plasmodium berghei]SCL82937.1 reticulocyte binding protein, putative [Plasmodium berghei]SCL84747.1 reticulocyte binding protein, putative [Plasmodium berghei]SCL85210.1 reticulocyte binding protein, putative [Plasmodium berghei]VUC54037.1 reticulocyte binding protein, putative [Plasmodium berghei ANKA]|eukprot:XP_034419884.1 reticulocyte binding protein, putative [Plasmodium berghei ANKA]
MGNCIYLKPIFIILLIYAGMIYRRNVWSYAHKNDSETTSFLFDDNISLNANSKNYQTNETNLNNPPILDEKFHDIENKSINQNDISNTSNPSYNNRMLETVPNYINDLNNDKNKNKQLINTTISFIDRPNAYILDDNILNNIGIIYGESKISLDDYYILIHYSILLTYFLYQFMYFKDHIDAIWKAYDQVNREIRNAEEECVDKRKKLAHKIDQLQDVIYNYKNKPNKDDDKTLKQITTEFIHCMNDKFITVYPSIFYMKNYADFVYHSVKLGTARYMDLCYEIRYKIVKTEFDNKLNRIRKSAILKSKEYVDLINKVIEIANNNEELKNVIYPLNFIKKYIEDIRKKRESFIIMLNTAYTLLIGISINTKKMNYSSKHESIKRITELADAYAYFNVNYKNIIDLESVYNNKIQAFNNVLNFMPHILIGKIDICTNHVVPNDDYDFKIIKPISILNKLENIFFKAFGFNFNEKYVKTPLEIPNSEINQIISETINNMKNLSDLIKKMENEYKQVETRHNIENTIKKLIIDVNLNQVQNKLTEAIQKARNWKSLKIETKKKLDNDNKTVLELETKIKDLCGKFTDKLNNPQFMKIYKNSLIKNHIILETSTSI